MKRFKECIGREPLYSVTDQTSAALPIIMFPKSVKQVADSWLETVFLLSCNLFHSVNIFSQFTSDVFVARNAWNASIQTVHLFVCMYHLWTDFDKILNWWHTLKFVLLAFTPCRVRITLISLHSPSRSSLLYKGIGTFCGSRVSVLWILREVQGKTFVTLWKVAMNPFEKNLCRNTLSTAVQNVHCLHWTISFSF
jgi:hypothetical protein